MPNSSEDKKKLVPKSFWVTKITKLLVIELLIIDYLLN